MNQALDRTFAALASEPRREILTLLSQHPTTIHELMEGFDFTKQAMTRHVAVLEKAGLVSRTVCGRDHHLQIVETQLESVVSWVDARKRAWRSNLNRLAVALEEED